MTILNYKSLFIILSLLVSIGCANNLKTIENEQKNQNIYRKRTLDCKIFNDADLYNTSEAKEFARLGMITLKKYFEHKSIVRIEVFFDDNYEKGKSVYILKNNHLYKMIKSRTWDKNKKIKKTCFFQDNFSITCTSKEIKNILHDVNIYIKY